jgi:methionyl-tRNA synthetase
MAKSPYYITTSIAYANAAPHIGYALELLIADAIARYQRLKGHEVYFLTGTDEHGIKIYNAAIAANMTPQAFVDKVSGEFQALSTALNISYTDFIRTTDQQRHWPAAQSVWEKLAAKGDIYPGHYQGYYCVNDEAYITETDYKSGDYANKTVIELSEDNYMLKLTGYQERLENSIGKELSIVPEHRGKEILNFIKTGVDDISVSRQIDKLPWGIPVPNDAGQVMYVWSDALVNYISALGYPDNSGNFKKFWPADVQVIGKDILRFHAVIWPAMLMGLDLPLPKQLLVHGFITSEGQKMSKSIGNVVSTDDLIKEFGAEATRYYLLSQIPTFDDGDYSHARMQEVYNSDLANNLGNLVSRVHKLVGSHGIKHVNEDPHPSIESEYAEFMNKYNLAGSIGSVMEYVSWLNLFISQEQPWVVAKTNLEQAQAALYCLLEGLRRVSILIYPFMPQTSDKIRQQLGFETINPTNFDFQQEIAWGKTSAEHRLGESAILFPRLDLAP